MLRASAGRRDVECIAQLCMRIRTEIREADTDEEDVQDQAVEYAHRIVVGPVPGKYSRL
jgi:hypothetical protein